MRKFRFHRAIPRVRDLTYRGKIMLIAFAGMNAPVVALTGYFILVDGVHLTTILTTMVVAVIATLTSSAATLIGLDHLMRPAIAVSRVMRAHRKKKQRAARLSAGAAGGMAAQTAIEQSRSPDAVRPEPPRPARGGKRSAWKKLVRTVWPSDGPEWQPRAAPAAGPLPEPPAPAPDEPIWAAWAREAEARAAPAPVPADHPPSRKRQRTRRQEDPPRLGPEADEPPWAEWERMAAAQEERARLEPVPGTRRRRAGDGPVRMARASPQSSGAARAAEVMEPADPVPVDRTSGLPDRAALLREIAARLERDGDIVVCAMRIEGCDQLAATAGRAAADGVITHLASQIHAIAAGHAYVAHIEPVVFGAVFAADGDKPALTGWVAEVLGSFGKPVVVESISTVPAVSVGLAHAPRDGREAGVLLDRAIAALEPRSIPAGAAAPVATVTEPAAAQRGWLDAERLKRALSDSEFCLHYQPVVDIDHGRTIGAEALIRWQHPQRGLLLPGTFIPMAEASGLTVPLGHWIIEAATTQLSEWAANGRDDLRIAINTSARQFHDPDLIRTITEALRGKQVGVGRLELELPAAVALGDSAHATRLLSRLRSAGIVTSIDDFGIGDLSLSRLLDLPFNLLRISRHFVSGVARSHKAHAICAGLIALAEDFEVDVMAEGVETAGELDLLRAMGVRRFQGYYLARPMPAEEFFRAANDLRPVAKAMAKSGASDQPPTGLAAGR